MKTATPQLLSHLQEELTFLCTVWRVERKDGTVYRFTDHDADVTVDVGGHGSATYEAAVGYDRSNLRTTSALAGANDLDVGGIIDSTGISEADLAAGLLDHATVEIFVVSWRNPQYGGMWLRAGNLGKVTWSEEAGYQTNIAGLAAYLDVNTGSFYTASCRVDLGSAKCGVRLDPPAWQASTAYTVRQVRDAGTGSVVKPTSQNRRHFKCVTAGTSSGSEPTWNTTLGGQTVDGTVVWEAIQALTVTGTVTSVTDPLREFEDTSLVEADDFYTFGVVTWLTGANAGLKMEVRTYTQAGGSVALNLDLPFAIQVGDTYTITAGCDKSRATCKAKFDNIYNFRGFPDVPGMGNLLRTPDAK